MKKRAQMEIVGLLVLVILIVVVLAISSMFTSKQAEKSSEPVTRSELDEKKSLSLLGPTIFESNHECNGRKVSLRELAEDHVFEGGKLCGNSSEELNKTLNVILEETLDIQGMNYTLIIKSFKEGDYRNLTISKTGCIYDKRRSIEITPTATTGLESLVLEVILC